MISFAVYRPLIPSLWLSSPIFWHLHIYSTCFVSRMSLQAVMTPSMQPHLARTRDLVRTLLFSRIDTEALDLHERINNAHNRARAIGVAYGWSISASLSLGLFTD